MECYIGIDLGSTTTKAVVLDENQQILGRGITNSRSNYDLAAQVAKHEAYCDTRFYLLRDSLRGRLDPDVLQKTLSTLSKAYRLEEHLLKLDHLRDYSLGESRLKRYDSAGFDVHGELVGAFDNIRESTIGGFDDDSERLSDFFRDLANTAFINEATRVSKKIPLAFDLLIGIFDKSIIKVENQVVESGFSQIMHAALNWMQKAGFETEILTRAIEETSSVRLAETSMVGTGYGRQRLPFPPEAIRSEILCHGLGAHFLFPDTATVLDIGGQDTKAIQVDSNGVVSGFQMNDRCAAGCGRYLGYIADEMNLGLHELGPLAKQASYTPKINSTCTVFAGTELRSRLLSGEKRADILSGLHRAIILRAMSLLARSGGVKNEFTFTGGVAKNSAAVAALENLVHENYGGEITINIHPDSIYMGALGAALFALEDRERIELSNSGEAVA